MKMLCRTLGLIVVASSLISLETFAAQDVGRLTLLSGPTLTAPPRGAVPKGQTINIPIASASHVRGQTTAVSPGTLRLSSEDPNHLVAPAAKNRLPPPESLRFDLKLHSPPPPPHMQFTPAPGRK